MAGIYVSVFASLYLRLLNLRYLLNKECLTFVAYFTVQVVIISYYLLYIYLTFLLWECVGWKQWLIYQSINHQYSKLMSLLKPTIWLKREKSLLPENVKCWARALHGLHWERNLESTVAVPSDKLDFYLISLMICDRHMP